MFNESTFSRIRSHLLKVKGERGRSVGEVKCKRGGARSLELGGDKGKEGKIKLNHSTQEERKMEKNGRMAKDMPFKQRGGL